MSVEIERLHERIDAIDAKLGQIVVSVTTMATTCAICKPIVIGNGKDGVIEQFGEVGSRLNALEQMSGLRSKGFWVALGVAGSLAVTLVGTAVGAGLHYFAR